jgi:hypothetical protein
VRVLNKCLLAGFSVIPSPGWVWSHKWLWSQSHRLFSLLHTRGSSVWQCISLVREECTVAATVSSSTVQQCPFLPKNSVFWWYWGLNLGPYACQAGIWSGPCHQPLNFFIAELSQTYRDSMCLIILISLSKYWLFGRNFRVSNKSYFYICKTYIGFCWCCL